MGTENLHKPTIAKAIKEAIDKKANKLNLTAEKVLTDIERIGGKAENAEKFGDALKSRELLGKHLKLFTEKVEVFQATPPNLTVNFVKIEGSKSD